jgi:hypothetical protein
MSGHWHFNGIDQIEYEKPVFEVAERDIQFGDVSSRR